MNKYHLELPFNGTAADIYIVQLLRECIQQVVGKTNITGRSITNLEVGTNLTKEELRDELKKSLKKLFPNFLKIIGPKFGRWVIRESTNLRKVMKPKNDYEQTFFEGDVYGLILEQMIEQYQQFVSLPDESKGAKKPRERIEKFLQATEIPLQKAIKDSKQVIDERLTELDKHAANFYEFIGKIIDDIRINGTINFDIQKEAILASQRCTICSSAILNPISQGNSNNYYRRTGTVAILGSGSYKYTNFSMTENIYEGKILYDQPVQPCGVCVLRGLTNWRIYGTRNREENYELLLSFTGKKEAEKIEQLAKNRRYLTNRLKEVKAFTEENEKEAEEEKNSFELFLDRKLTKTLTKSDVAFLNFDGNYYGLCAFNLTRKAKGKKKGLDPSGLGNSFDTIPMLTFLGAIVDAYPHIEVIDFNTLQSMSKVDPQLKTRARNYYLVAEWCLKNRSYRQNSKYDEVLVETKAIMNNPWQRISRHLRNMIMGVGRRKKNKIRGNKLKQAIKELTKLVEEVFERTPEQEFTEKIAKFLIDIGIIPDKLEKPNANELTAPFYDLFRYVKKNGPKNGIRAWLSHLERTDAHTKSERTGKPIDDEELVKECLEIEPYLVETVPSLDLERMTQVSLHSVLKVLSSN